MLMRKFEKIGYGFVSKNEPEVESKANDCTPNEEAITITVLDPYTIYAAAIWLFPLEARVFTSRGAL